MDDEQNRRKLSRRKFLLSSAVASASALGLAACGNTGSQASPSSSASTSGSASASASAGASGSGWTGTITMYAQQYTPIARDKEPKLQAFRQIADENQQQHPA